MFHIDRLTPLKANMELEYIKIPGVERALLWDYKKDSIPVHNYLKELRQLGDEIRHCRTRYPELYRHLKLIKHRMMEDYENKIDRIWNDQRTGTFFRKGDRFEPHEVRKQHNLTMWDGITGYTEFAAGESTDYFAFMGAGIGTTKPTFADPSLEVEVVRVDVRAAGDLNSDGIVLKSSAAFPPGVPDKFITEFAGFDKETAGRMEYRVVIDPPLHQIPEVTFMQASHNTVFQAVEEDDEEE